MLRRSNSLPRTWVAACERWLEAEREQLPLWVPLALVAGICSWFALPTSALWTSWAVAGLALALLVAGFGGGGRWPYTIAKAALLFSAGLLLVWGKALVVGQPPLARPAVVKFTANVVAVEPVPARQLMRLDLVPQARPDLPALLQVNVRQEDMPAGMTAGAQVAMRARLMPPAGPALPGGYDFARRAFFAGIGASGRALGPVILLHRAASGPGLREKIGAHVRDRLPGPEGAIAAALANGDQASIAQQDVEAMRRSGLAHLLSISGLHVSALIGAVILVARRSLALSPRIALRWPVPLLSACCGAAAGIGYTLLTGSQVPTVRSCVAALLVIGGLACGREAISLRLIAAGAVVVLLIWPESAIGPSFQMSFAAVAALVALYEHPRARALFEAREEALWRKVLRHVGALFLTGLLVELVLAPIAFAHFHRAGLLGSLANLIAIPLTSFVIMPAEGLALLLDLAGLGAPAWWVTGAALRLLLHVAHLVAAQPFATYSVPVGGPALLAITMAGMLWMMLWRTPVRWLGAPVMLAGTALTITSPAPDALVTSDGRHVALRTADGGMALLRDRAGDYVRSSLAEAAAFGGEFGALDKAGNAICSRDLCEATIHGTDGSSATLLATRSGVMVSREDMARACAAVDIAVSDRLLPSDCRPRWARLDRLALASVGGALILVGPRRIVTGRAPEDQHPWSVRDDRRER